VFISCCIASHSVRRVVAICVFEVAAQAGGVCVPYAAAASCPTL